jgi:hypothetical protein
MAAGNDAEESGRPEKVVDEDRRSAELIEGHLHSSPADPEEDTAP